MANIKISDLTAAASVSGAQQFEVNEAGTSKKVTGAQIAAYVEGEVSSSPSFTGQASVAAGSAASPSITVTGDTNTGVYFPAADTIGISTGGTLRVSVDPAGSLVTAGNIELGNATDTTISRVSAGVIAVEGGVIPKENRTNTFSTDQIFNTKVGIGTATPNAQLEINSATIPDMRLSISGTTQANFYATTAGVVLVTVPAISLILGSNNTERMRITSSGGVSFGSSGTAYGTSGQVLISNGNAPPSWGSGGGVTLLGTMTAAGASTMTLSVTLTNYKFIRFVLRAISSNLGAGATFSIGTAAFASTDSAGGIVYGFVDLDLATGMLVSTWSNTLGVGQTSRINDSGYSTATTTIVASASAGVFDNGTITVYGMK